VVAVVVQHQTQVEPVALAVVVLAGMEPHLRTAKLELPTQAAVAVVRQVTVVEPKTAALAAPA
jgi:hypothetical protein